MSQVSDELLVAYLDGQLGAPQSRSVERMINASDDLRERIERLKATQAYLIQTFEALARRGRASAQPARSSAPAGGSRQPQSSTPGTRASGGNGRPVRHATREPEASGSMGSARRMLVWAAILSIIAAVLGYGAAQWLRAGGTPGLHKIGARVPPPAGRWAVDVARLHSHFTVASVSADPESQTNRDLVELQLSRVVNKPVPVPSFDDHDLTLRRGQVLSYRGSQMMQLSYAGADAGLVALYVMPGGPSSRASVSVEGDVTTVTWGASGVRYVLAGQLPENSLRALAAVALAQTQIR